MYETQLVVGETMAGNVGLASRQGGVSEGSSPKFFNVSSEKTTSLWITSGGHKFGWYWLGSIFLLPSVSEIMPPLVSSRSHRHVALNIFIRHVISETAGSIVVKFCIYVRNIM